MRCRRLELVVHPRCNWVGLGDNLVHCSSVDRCSVEPDMLARCSLADRCFGLVDILAGCTDPVVVGTEPVDILAVQSCSVQVDRLDLAGDYSVQL